MLESVPNTLAALIYYISYLLQNNATMKLLILSLSLPIVAQANPKSRPYVAYRTDPFDQEIVTTRVLFDGIETRGGSSGSNNSGGGVIRKNRAAPIDIHNINKYDKSGGGGDPRCPLSFRLGSTHSAHFGATSSSSNNENNSNTGVGTHTPPIIYPLHPDFDAGSGRQILLTTDYEVLEMWTPSSAIGTHALDYNNKNGHNNNAGGKGGVEGQSTEQLKEDEQFPLLFESSSFYFSSPIVHDVEGDGVTDAILGDYDGNIHLVGLDFEHITTNNNHQQTTKKQRRKRYYKRISIPRLFIRKSWYEVAINRTKENEDMAQQMEQQEEEKGNATKTKWEEFEPYHTYFASSGDTSWRGKNDEMKARGISANVLNMDSSLAKGLAERRREEEDLERRNRRRGKSMDDVDHGVGKEQQQQHRRLQEISQEEGNGLSENNVVEQEQPNSEEQLHDEEVYYHDDVMFAEDPGLTGDDYYRTESMDGEGDQAGATTEGGDKGDVPMNLGDDYYPAEREDLSAMDDYTMMMDDYARHRYGYGDDIYEPAAPDGWDSYNEYQAAQDKYYHDSNYLRLPPHLLSTCTLAELPRAYAGSSSDRMDKIDEMVLCAVSYYFDEDECKDPMGGSGQSFGKHANADGGDETEEQRGRYVANAIMGYNLRWKYWSIQEVLDLSTDWSAPLGDIVSGGTAPINSDAHGGMGAWALATPIAVKLDGGDKNHIILGTSMGLVYALEAQWHGIKSGWPIQMRHPVEQKVLVEDVVGNTNLEVFVVSTGGDLVSLNADGGVLWARNLLTAEETAFGEAKALIVRGTSPMSMGDIDGTGRLAIVVVATVAFTEQQHLHRPDKHEVLEHRLYAIDAVTGDDLEHFPIILNKGGGEKTPPATPQPLLIDLHEDQRHWLDQIHGLSSDNIDEIRQINRRAALRPDINGSQQPRPHGGAGRGLHVVQPLGSTLYIIEGSTACSQTVDVGESIPSMVQADDVHGTGGLDLVVTTARGEILTLESDTVSYHSMNVWNAGVTRAPGSSNAQAHGFSSTQGIFVHPMSRVWRDVLGVYIPITFEIFDRRPNIANEPNRQVYEVEVRAGMSAKRTIFLRSYNATGTYTERVQIPYGPGYYSLTVLLRTTHGIVYEDTFHLGFNVDYMGGLWLIVCLPLVLAAIPILMFRRKPNWEDDDYGNGSNYGSRSGILGRTPP